MTGLLLRGFRLLGLAAFIGGASSARADFITYEGTGSTGSSTSLHAVDVSAKFSVTGFDLTVTLSSNLATVDPVQALTGLVWDITGTAPTATTISSAVTGINSALYSDATSHTSNADVSNATLGGKKGWQYEAGVAAPLLTVASHHYQFGLGASGLAGVFGGLGNSDYGIVGAKSTIGSSPLNNQLPLVMSTDTGATPAASSIVFVIHNFTVAASTISNVEFMFGSAGSDNVAGVRAVPEPSSFALLGVGGIFCAELLRRRRRASA